MIKSHVPVMLDEAIDGLQIKASGVYVDATFGRGGHSLAILNQLGDQAKLFAFDKDPEAVKFAQKNITDKRFTVSHMSYAKMPEMLLSCGYKGKVDGILMDLGVSSPQLDCGERGFSFQKNGPLDMRMDNTSGMTAEEWVNSVEEEKIIQALFLYGEEKFARIIAQAIVKYRKLKRIHDTHTLVSIIKDAVKNRYQREKHPATRTFQALRIVINSELDELQQSLDDAVDLLAPGGRLVIISFHSLEHRLVKKFMQSYLPGNATQDQISFGSKQIKFKKISKICASEKEQRMNTRSRTAMCRVVERLPC